ncbi:U-box domain-containing protein 4 [Impatiens glandulifera]|uniref:U-box domain-containing protein 4 n=1 Tax=Impatiens glandulifera TaxID=253017 RepID=UPI001FB13EBC|nr:U-box domain-containing protein 4 [Impatiens glandulifera]
MEFSGTSPDTDSPTNTSDSSSSSLAVQLTLRLLQSDDPSSNIKAAKEIRRLTKTSSKSRRHLSLAIQPLVRMLTSNCLVSNESALLALLNLAVKDEKNKVSIVNAGALGPIVSFLRSNNLTLQEHATASLLTLSASTTNKPIIGSSGAIPLLVQTLGHEISQTKADALMALYNLSTHSETLRDSILEANPIPYIVNMLKRSKKSSKTAEKCTALLESLVATEPGRIMLTSEEGGVLSVVEVLESGSVLGREHAVGTLLTMCESDRCKYREPILREGVIPGLLELTVQGGEKSQGKAQRLLRLLRASTNPRSEFEPDTLENIVYNIISGIGNEEQCGKAKQMLAEMVQVSMEQSLRHLEKRAAPAIASCASSK